MFKKARHKIVISIMAILFAVLLGTLGMIYLSSYLSLTSQNYDLLESHVQTLAGRQYYLPGNVAAGKIPNDYKAPDVGMHNQEKFEHRLEVNTFYSVIVSDNENATVIENGANRIYSDDELILIAKSVSTKSRGSTDNLIFITKNCDGNILVCFMDNAVFANGFTSVFLFTLVFGIIALAVIAFISVRIARKIVSPMEDTYQKQKQFTADAGHELKTPIAAMTANIELLRREIGENKWLDNISYENIRMQDLVTELLELARNENRTADIKPTNLSRTVNGAILPLEASAFEKKILIDSDIQEGITANVDEKSITQLVTILVDNAISHTEHHDEQIEKVSVKLYKNTKGMPELSISNPGKEIPEKDREKLFERFYRADASHEFTGHYGLGLAIAKSIAEINKAKISIVCENDIVTFKVNFVATKNI